MVLSKIVMSSFIRIWLWRAAIAVVVCIAVLLLSFSYLLLGPMPIKDSHVYEVTAGSGSSRIANQLTREGWVTDPALVKLAVNLYPGWVPKVGQYQLEPGMSLLDVLRLIHSGRGIVHNITLVEGKTVKDYLLRMQSKGNIEMTLLDMTNEEIAKQLNLDVDHAEGQFFANTYNYHDGNTDASILLQANQKLQSILENNWQKRDKDIPLETAQEALILASIVEKETGAAFERPLIAGVFVNRLNKGMRLQTDPTVIYGLGDSFDGNIRRRHLRQKTPYNTYTIYGLPPTPIANVGEDAIKAALNPETTKALYFVAKGDGTHAFSNTLKQHNAAVAKYQRFQRRSDYQSTPNTTSSE